MAEKRAADHAAKLERAAAVMATIKPGQDVKERLAAKVGVKAKSITRWVNSGEITVPARLAAFLHLTPKVGTPVSPGD